VIEITSTEVNKVLFMHLAGELNRGRLVDELMRQGVSPDTCDRLRQLSVADLDSIIKLGKGAISFTVDGAALNHAVRTNLSIERDQSIIQYFLEHGATIKMMDHLFKLTREEVEQYRDAWGFKVRQGKPPQITSKQQDSILANWRSITATTERDRYHQLHRQFPNTSLASLFTLINNARLAGML
jgi:hypothetical protein